MDHCATFVRNRSLQANARTDTSAELVRGIEPRVYIGRLRHSYFAFSWRNPNRGAPTASDSRDFSSEPVDQARFPPTGRCASTSPFDSLVEIASLRRGAAWKKRFDDSNRISRRSSSFDVDVFRSAKKYLDSSDIAAGKPDPSLEASSHQVRCVGRARESPRSDW